MAKDLFNEKLPRLTAYALNSRSRTVFDPPMREFLRKNFDVTIENVRKFHEWRDYLYLNVLGFSTGARGYHGLAGRDPAAEGSVKCCEPKTHSQLPFS